eukprot:NODE_288_length_10680_cov_0.431245.p6 type:complete len:276 gc:universal NODE_288_length_10680_cov_0.431245:3659-4486(+)
MSKNIKLFGSDLFSQLIYQRLSKHHDIKFHCKYCPNLCSSFGDINIVASFGVKIPSNIVENNGLWLNVHPSILPEYRGPTPLEHNLLYGNQMGVTLIRLAERIDSGDIYAQRKIPYVLQPYHQSLVYHADTAADLLLKNLPYINDIQTTPQIGVPTFSRKLKPDLAFIDFNSTTNIDILRRFYAISHRYRLRTKWRSHQMFINRLNISNINLKPGVFTINENGTINVGCKSGSLLISCVSRISGIKCDPASFFHGLRYKEKSGHFPERFSESFVG